MKRYHVEKNLLHLIFIATVILLGCGSDSKTQQNTGRSSLTYSTEDSPGLEQRQKITISLPGLPEEAKKLEMVLIQPGTFTMGAPMDERGRRNEYDWPPHQVTITRSFYMGIYEITQAQWEAVMGNGSQRSKFLGKNHPVGKVSWKNCQQFVKRLNAFGLGIFRLPTEAEWEYACRAGTETRYFFGEALECTDTGADSCEIADQYMWWSGNIDSAGTQEVGSKLPNPWGLHDMHGNVSEWCSDVWETPHDRGAQKDPAGPALNCFNRWWPLTNHVNRGGSIYRGRRFHDGMRDCRSASRFYEQAFDFHYSLGFRVVSEYP